MINLINYFKQIQEINYALTKIDVPYNTSDFPNTYPVGKDLDIFVSIDDFEKIKKITNNFLKDYRKDFIIKIICTKNNIRFRLENKKKLHYQIDITIEFDSILENKIKNDIYNILSLNNEAIIRKLEIKKNPHKIHHLEWLKKFNFI